MYTLSEHMHACVNSPSNTNNVILPHEENHGITLRCLKQVLIPITEILQCRATQWASQFLRHPAGTMYRICKVLAHEASIQCLWAACCSPS